ncbi:MAG: CBS domain-containing protein [Chloroflexota bacterium]
MKREVMAVLPGTTVCEAARVLVEGHVGTLPVVDANRVLLGIVGVTEILTIFLPDFVALLEDIDFVKDFGALEDLGPKDVPEAGTLTVKDIMKEPIAVEEDAGLLRAFALMKKHTLRDLPVVSKDGKLLGIVSQVDIACGFLSTWAENRSHVQ